MKKIRYAKSDKDDTRPAEGADDSEPNDREKDTLLEEKL